MTPNFCSRKFSKNFDTRYNVSLASNAQVTQVFQATVCVLHNLHKHIHIDIGHNFANALAVARAVVF